MNVRDLTTEEIEFSIQELDPREYDLTDAQWVALGELHDERIRRAREDSFMGRNVQ